MHSTLFPLIGNKAPLEPRVFNITATAASFHYPTSIDEQWIQIIRYEIKPRNWSRSEKVECQGNRQGRNHKSEIASLVPQSSYTVRAVITVKTPLHECNSNNIIGPETDFTTDILTTNNPLDRKPSLIGTGIVELRWTNPWISRSTNPCTSAPTDCNTTVLVQLMNSTLFVWPTKKFPNNADVCIGNRSYELSTATTYRFVVTMVNSYKQTLESVVDYWIPASVGFDRDEKLEVEETDTSVDIRIPKILNIKSDSVVKIIVEGTSTCSSQSVPPIFRRLLINGNDSSMAWIAQRFEDPKNVTQKYSIEKIPNDKKSPRCHLRSAETYYVIVAVVNRTGQVFAKLSSNPINLKTFKANNKQTWVWFYIVLILVICLLITTLGVFLFYTGRKRMKSRTMDTDEVTMITPIGTPGDWQFDGCSLPVKLKQFEQYVKKAVADRELELQFKSLPTGLLHPHRLASLPENKTKNRDENFIAYDHTRVILAKRSCNFGSDYINASYIPGFCKEWGYIATQAPMPKTVVDFWKMIWQEEVLIVCMLMKITEGGQKICKQYWPEIGNTVEHGQITILNVKQRVYADYTHRIFQVTKFTTFTGRPKQEVPMYWRSVVEYFNELRGHSSGPGPILVHCATGTGRTGTFILCDIGLHSTAAEGTVDLFAEADKMYTARANMLENLQQYILAHLLPMQCLLTLPAKLSCSDVSRAEIEKMKIDLRTHMRRCVSANKNLLRRHVDEKPVHLPEMSNYSL